MRFAARQRRADDIYELDLAPMLSMMVALIPILLLSSVFVHVKLIETPLPQIVQEAIERDKNDNDPKVTVNVQVSANSGFDVIVNRNSQKSISQIPLKDAKLDFKRLSVNLWHVKKQYPEVFRLSIDPEDSVPYEELVKVMDAARRIPGDKPKIKLKSKKKNQTVETDLMFPNATFADVLEG